MSLVPLLLAAILPIGCNGISGIGDLAVGDDIADADTAGEDSNSSTRPTGSDATTLGDATASTDGTTPKEAGASDTGTSDTGASDARVVDANQSDGALTSKRVFASSGKLTGDMGGIAGGDNLCAQAAANAGLGGTWVAWLSTTKKEAIDRITYQGRYVRLDGLEVVANKAQLASSNLTNPISLTENNTPVDPDSTATKNIWTGRNATANPDGSSCNDWTSNSSVVFGSRGHSGSTATPNWTQVAGFAVGGWGCQTPLSIYCFEL